MNAVHPEGGSSSGGAARFSNNFDFLRFVAAAAVIVTHAYALTVGYPNMRLYDPVLLMGQAALATFFVISGYLIPISWESTASPLRFAWKRFLRIVPALVPALFITLFIIGPLMTSLPPAEYYGALFSLEGFFSVPFFEDGGVIGLFQENPVTYVNGSLWVIPVEVVMYGVVAVLGLAGLLRQRGAIISLAAVNVLLWIVWFDDPRMAKVRFTLYFLIGAYFSLHRRHITYRPLIAGILLVVLGLSVLTPHPPVAGVVCIPYLVLYAAQIRIPLLNNFGRAGDFSYGMYVYHYPIQQALIQISGNTLFLPALCGLSFLLVLPLAFLSWHTIEKWALAAKNLGPRDLRRVFGLPDAVTDPGPTRK
ncbi:acyltransferase family protein [Methanoculleus bourgensis]|jgi:peptidoglycan/LPS O-acetylase OafA/YrhL|uniref:O-acetyl transferase n=1 Tax=Methanoculleus bourgensis TaxID=83986 RepID=A0A0X3BI14_9EURY|nr:acyltransferase [Methanoculleus bourgensis]CVK31767.1 O-acetyl transferase [Methanoculleus bourgensis]